ncbi:hypothetical protein Tco_0059594 [Tanacetum coccineum]
MSTFGSLLKDNFTDIRRKERLEDLKGLLVDIYNLINIKVVNILLLGLLVDIYNLINHYQTAKKIYDRVKEILEGTKITKQEHESMLYDEFDKFTSEPGESIHSYYLRFAKLINDMNMISLTMTPMQINTKFVNHLQPEWSSYAPTVVQQPPTFQPDIGLAIPTFLPTDDPIASLNKSMIFLSSVYHSKFSPMNNQLRTLSNLRTQATIQNGQVTIQNVQGRQSQGYAGNAGNIQASGARVINAVGNTGAKGNCNLHGKFSPVGSFNDDTVAPRYDSDTLSESYDELKDNSDVISYIDYMLIIRDDADNYVPPLIQKNDMMLSVIEQMKSQVENYNKVNQESKSEIESLTSEHERYKDRVRVLGYAVKDGHFEQEVYRNHELYTVINERNRKVKDFEKQVFSQETQTKDLNNHIAFLKKNFETLKQESSIKYEKNISEIVDLEKVKKELENIEQLDIKGAFNEDVIPFSENLKETFKFFEKGFIIEVKEMKYIFKQMEDEVDQCSMAKKSFEIEKKQLLINNDRLLEENIASDIMCTYLRSLNEVDNYGKCKSLDIVLLDLQESKKSLSELRNCFAKLEEYNITLDIAFQNHKEQMILNNPDTKNKQLLVKRINNQSVEINDLKVYLQDKLHVINELKHLLAQKSQKTQCELLVFDSRIQKIEDENVSLAF